MVKIEEITEALVGKIQTKLSGIQVYAGYFNVKKGSPSVSVMHISTREYPNVMTFTTGMPRSRWHRYRILIHASTEERLEQLAQDIDDALKYNAFTSSYSWCADIRLSSMSPRTLTVEAPILIGKEVYVEIEDNTAV